MRKLTWLFAIVLLVQTVVPAVGLSVRPVSGAAPAKIHSTTLLQSSKLPGLMAPVRLVRDQEHIPHIYAQNDHDAYLVMGYIQAQDRFFQMDFNRRQASGTLAELVGSAGLESDTQLRLFGLRRGAEESLPGYSASIRAGLQAYADGVNAFLDDPTLPLSPEYQALELSRAQIPRWTPLDSLTIGKATAFSLSFDVTLELSLSLALGIFQQAGQRGGFDGTKLFFEDVFRSAPFEASPSIPDFFEKAGLRSSTVDSRPLQDLIASVKAASAEMQPESLQLAAQWLDKVKSDPYLQRIFDRSAFPKGSNWWIVGGDHTTTGNPMLASDPHLSLSTPSVWYEIHLNVANDPERGPMNVNGVSFPGIPGVVLGANDRICWGATVNILDTGDAFQEELVLDRKTSVPKFSKFNGKKEPVIVLPQTYRVNRIGDGTADTLETATVPPQAAVVVLLPRRNNGPIINLVPDSKKKTKGVGISIQYSGFRATRELDAFLSWNRAGSVEEFKEGLQFFDFGAQNFACADRDGNIGYFTSAEMPLREDLQKLGRVDGMPPFLLRDGTGVRKNEWLPVTNRQPGQALNYEILPFAEMPQVVNPSAGFITNCNQDPVGTSFDNNPLNQLRKGGGIYYLSPGYADGNRQGRIQRLLQAKLANGGKVSLQDLQAMQHNHQMLDAEVLTPFILTAFQNASAASAPDALKALGQDAGIREAVERFQGWDFSSPTGIREGYDPDDDWRNLPEPSAAEIEHSVAAATYAVWRSQMVQNVIDTTLSRVGAGFALPPGDLAMGPLRNLLDKFPTAKGKGASGVNFFEVTGVSDPDAARDIIILRSLRQGLDLLASPLMAPAYARSTNQNDYRWGRLHRITFDHPLGGPFDVPNAGGFSSLGNGLPGLAKAGGYEVLDASTHSVRMSNTGSGTFGGGPSRRFVGEVTSSGVNAFQILPGGESGNVTSPFYANQVGRWLTNKYHPLLLTDAEVEAAKVEEVTFTN
ncbi:MAG TPA: penicillin acylase family protein [Acidobacteriota bacterium]|nr:penicillin acylase family protein [Acidobacteriota bacterium]HNB73000.1 penicillin acylase family protein [Acidobacteriota bacterium]HNH82776.1 penicillin acylase family protein [Acidobacteriota bacterium]